MTQTYYLWEHLTIAEQMPWRDKAHELISKGYIQAELIQTEITRIAKRMYHAEALNHSNDPVDI